MAFTGRADSVGYQWRRVGGGGVRAEAVVYASGPLSIGGAAFPLVAHPTCSIDSADVGTVWRRYDPGTEARPEQMPIYMGLGEALDGRGRFRVEVTAGSGPARDSIVALVAGAVLQRAARLRAAGK